MDAGAPQFFDATAFANEGFEPIRCRVLGVLGVLPIDVVYAVDG